MKKILVIGEILVEIMADETGQGFLEPLALTGPFPSGAPAIFASQVARMGHPCAIISAVGQDDFGRINLDRLQADGVDISAVAIDTDRPTGHAFVRYRPDGNRDFIFNIRHAACGFIPVDAPATRQAITDAAHLHVMGSSLSSQALIALNLEAARAIKARGGSVSFDPNLRKEILSAPEMAENLVRILRMTDLYLPSGPELTLLTQSQTEEAAIAELLAMGIKAVVHKKGRDGVTFHDHDQRIDISAYPAIEVDPTGAGDCFGGAFTALWLQGTPLLRALKLAAAAGAFAVGKRGPMEGASHLATLDAFVAQYEKSAS